MLLRCTKNDRELVLGNNLKAQYLNGRDRMIIIMMIFAIQPWQDLR